MRSQYSSALTLPAIVGLSLFAILLEDELAVGRRAAPLDPARPRNADDGEVVLHREDAGLRAVADLRADVVDVSIALGALPQHDGGHLRAIDRGRCHRDRRHVELDAERLDVLAVLRQRLDGPFLVELRRGHAAADVVDAEGGHRLQGGVVIAVLRADLELHFRRRRVGSGGCRPFWATCAETSVSAIAPAAIPLPASRTNSRRSISDLLYLLNY